MSFRPALVVTLAVLLGGSASGFAVETGPDQTAAAPSAAQLAEAEQKVTAGLQAMQESNTTTSRVVDAAMLFTEALKAYESAGETEKARELQANIYWCKKRMNLDDLNAFLARKGQDPVATATVARMKAVAEREVPKEEAQEYFDRAEAFAKKNPGRHLLIAIRYFEVAERFAGTEPSLKAQRASLEAQQQHMKTLNAQAGPKRETLFSRPAAGAAGGTAPMPDAAAQKSALATLKKVYAQDYARIRPAQKQDFAWKLIEEGRKSKDDTQTRFVMYSEAIRIAQGVDDVCAVLTAIDALAASYTGYDMQAERTAAIAKMRSETGVAAAQLFANPWDEAANTVVGKQFCLLSKGWDAGLQLLANGADADYKRVAEMELAKPSGAAQQAELGGRWFDLVAKAKATQKEALYGRARHWYKLALKGGIEGVSKDLVNRRLDEIWAAFPDPETDWNALTPTQWDVLKAPEFSVRVGVAKNDPKLTLKAGQRVRVVPHPTDTWKSSDWNGDVTCDWKGVSRAYGTANGLKFMALMVTVENGAAAKPGVHAGPGRVFLAANDPYTAGISGAIRVKLIVLED